MYVLRKTRGWAAWFAITICAFSLVAPAAELQLPASFKCLTGNAAGKLAAQNVKIPAFYTYNDAFTDSEFFPSWVTENNRSTGWVSIANGLLTDGKASPYLRWPHYWMGQHGIDVVFDLKKEYLIHRVDVECARPTIPNSALFLKSPGETHYTRVAMLADPYQPGFKEGELKQSFAFENVNSCAQWVRIQMIGGRYMDLTEIRIWGEERPAEAPPKKPILLGQEVIKEPREVPFQLPPDAVVFPIPQQMKLTGQDFPLKAETVIVLGTDSERARITAEVLRDEIQRETGLALAIRPAARSDAQNVILLKDEPVAPADKPQGYVLESGPQRVVIRGADPTGTFYGTQTLLQLLKRAGEGWVVRGAAIQDWPECPIRLIQGRRAVDENLIRALARFKINYYQIYSFNTAERDSAFTPIAERYCVKLMLPAEPRMLISVNPEFAELKPGERLEDLEKSRVNFCPSHPKTWETYFGMVDKWVDKFNADYVSINFDEMYQTSHGSRWNVCPHCRARNMSGWQLLAWTLNHMHQYFQKHGKKLFMLDTCFYGPSISYDGDPDKDWRKALDHIPNDILQGVWHPKEVNALFAEKGFPQIRWINSPYGQKAQGFPKTAYAEARYVGICVNMLDGPFSYTRLIGTSQVSWSPGRAYPEEELGGMMMDRFMPLLARILDNRRSPASEASPDRFFPIDLSGVANRSFRDDQPGDGKGWVDLGPNLDLRCIRPGKQILADVPFTILDESKNNGRGCVMLHNWGYADRTLPSRVEIPVGRKAASIVFLHTLQDMPGQSYLRRNEHAGWYFMVYADDTYATYEIKYNINIAPWLGGERDAEGHFPSPIAVKAGRAAWRGETRSGRAAHLYAAEWVNPRPDAEISKIIFQAAWKKSTMNPILVAATGVAPSGAEPSEKGRWNKLSDILPAEPVGKPIDLAGGVEESLQKYVAPNGIVVECSQPYRLDKYHAGCHDFLSSAACAVHDGNHFFLPKEAGELTITFPQPMMLSGFMVRCPPRHERKADDFGQSGASYEVQVSPDGTNWSSAGRLSLREEQGPRFFALPKDRIRALRIRGGGVVGLRLYTPE